MAYVFATLRQGVSAMPRLHFSRPTNVELCILKIVRAFHPGAARNIPHRPQTTDRPAGFVLHSKEDESIKFEKGSKYPILKRAQEQYPEQWPDLVLQIGHLELLELKNPAAAAKTLAKGLRFTPELAVPLDQLMMSAETASKQKWDPQDGHRALAYIDPLETQRYLAKAREHEGTKGSGLFVLDTELTTPHSLHTLWAAIPVDTTDSTVVVLLNPLSADVTGIPEVTRVELVRRGGGKGTGPFNE